MGFSKVVFLHIRAKSLRTKVIMKRIARKFPFNSFFIICIALMSATRLKCLSGKKRHYYYAHSVKGVRDLANRDFLTALELQNRFNGEPSVVLPNAVHEYLHDFSNTTNGVRRANETSIKQHIEEALRNPLAAFRLINRAANFLNSNGTDAKDVTAGLPLSELRENFDDDAAPLRDDLVDAAETILKIHFMYNLDASDLAAGKVGGIETGTRLLAVHCFHIGRIANVQRKYTLAVEWLNEAKQLAIVDSTIEIPAVEAELFDVIKQHNVRWEQQDASDANCFISPLKHSRRIDTYGGTNNSKVKDMLVNKHAGKSRNCSYWRLNAWALCSGQTFHTGKISSHLFCWLEFKINKIFTIGPLRVEFLSRNPDIVQINEAFGPKAVNNMLRESDNSRGAPKLRNSTDEGWFNTKIAAMIGSRRKGLKDAEETEFVHNFPGGQDEIHVGSDKDEEEADDTEDRIATLMVNLGTVEAGGYTAFPAAFATSKPNQGSAIFWFNSFPDGTADLSTEHVDCPVAFGGTWSMYKHIRFYDQFTAKTCPLGPTERFQFRVNGQLPAIPVALQHPLINEQDCENPIPLSASEGEPWEAVKLVENSIWKRRTGKYACASIRGLRSLISLDRDVYSIVKAIFAKTIMEEHTEHGPSALRDREMIFRYMQDFNETAVNLTLAADVSSDDISTKLILNPLAVYRILWRFENYVKQWLTQAPEKQGYLLYQIRERIGKVYNMSGGPFPGDLEDAMAGILQAQHVHDLRTADISRGVLGGTDVGILLSAAECIEMGKQANAMSYFYLAVLWMETALTKIITEGDQSIDLPTAELELATTKALHDKFRGKSDPLAPLFFTQPVSTTGTNMSNSTNLQTLRQVLYDRYKFRMEEEFLDINYCGICQRKAHQTAKEKSRLFCWLEKEIHPYWKIRPLKAEILSLFPKAEVVKYHDVIGERLMAFLRDGANTEHIRPSTLIIPAPELRLSTSHWMRLNGSSSSAGNKEQLEILKLAHRITGLNVMKKEGEETFVLQFAAYTPGGHYATHLDSMDYDESPQFCRLATFMFYLTDELEGGGTPFSQSGVLATPTKGSALFWYNMLSSGEKDDYTHHGSCPVIFGEKLIATYWMNYGNQDHLRCPPVPRQRIEVLVNGKSKYETNHLPSHHLIGQSVAKF